MKNAIKYKDTWAAKGSPLAVAIEESPATAKKIYDETTDRFDAMYPGAKDDRIALTKMMKEFANAA
ncbi:MAG: hypothetical protein NVS3B3_04360 [Aquirhabdus sp.]